MKELTCKNCGGVGLLKKNGIWICGYCGSRFVDESGCEEKIRYYRNKAEEALDRDRYREMNDYALKILALDPENASGWLYRMYYYILSEEDYFDEIIDAGQKAIQYETKDAGQRKEFVYDLFLSLGRGEIRSAVRSLKEAVKEISKPQEDRDILTGFGIHLPDPESLYRDSGLAYRQMDQALSAAEMSVFSENAEEKRKYREALWYGEETIYLQEAIQKTGVIAKENSVDLYYEKETQARLWQAIGIDREQEIMPEVDKKYRTEFPDDAFLVDLDDRH